jgi:RimJ/RimL family protein N-acetyltransferase
MQLRPMTMADSDKMLEWKNYPETRKYAIASHDIITKEAHYKWLEENLQYFKVIGELYGAVRIQDNEVSIWMDKKYWAKGIASFVLEMIYEDGMFAKIVNGNIPSMRTFIRAGFKPFSYHKNYYIFKK